MKTPSRLPAKLIAFVLAGWSMAHTAIAQEPIPPEKAQEIAHKLIAASTPSSDLPFAVDANAETARGIKGGEAGLIVMPDKQLTADTLAKAGKTITPVAQLWTYRLNLAADGKSVDSARIRLVTVTDGDKTRDVQLFLLGVTKNDQGAVELVIYSKGSDPILRIPLTKSSATTPDFQIEISGRKTGDGTGALTLDLPGQNTVDLAMLAAGE